MPSQKREEFRGEGGLVRGLPDGKAFREVQDVGKASLGHCKAPLLHKRFNLIRRQVAGGPGGGGDSKVSLGSWRHPETPRRAHQNEMHLVRKSASTTLSGNLLPFMAKPLSST